MAIGDVAMGCTALVNLKHTEQHIHNKQHDSILLVQTKTHYVLDKTEWQQAHR